MPLIFMIIGLVIVLTMPANAETPARDLYKVGIDDVIDLNVLNHHELTITATVSSDGTIAYPFLGDVYVKGKTLSEIEEEITRRLSEGFVKYPVVTVSLLKSLSRKIFVYGEVARTGEFQYEEGMTLEMALSLVGGPLNEGLFGKIVIRRKPEDSNDYKDIAEVQLNNGFILNKSMENMPLHVGDILKIERNKTFLIEGEAARRGRFELEKDTTILKALLQAGGVTDNGLYGKIKVRRKQGNGTEGYKDIAESKLNEGIIEDKEVEDVELQPDDILIVERSKTFLIEGEAARRGRFELEKDTTVLKALLQAGGVTDNGLYGKIKVRRKQGNGTEGYKDIAESKLNEGIIEDKEVEDVELQPDDILIVERSKTFLIEGEVTRRGLSVLEKDMTVLKALLQAGGLTENGMYGTIKVRRKQEKTGDGYEDIAVSKINDGAIEDKKVEDITLHTDDILLVERNKTYFVYGEVNLPGEFVLKGDMTVFKAIILAGGFTKWGSESKVRILRPADTETGVVSMNVNIDKVIKGDASADVKLNPGDTIIVSAGLF